MKAAEAAFDLMTGGPEPVLLTEVVRQKVEQSFPPEQQAEVIRLLERECANNLSLIDIETPEGLERIRLDVLKLADGSEAELRRQIDTAKSDWRDVISAAEYPEAYGLGLLEHSKLDEKTREQIQQRDRDQYLAWLGQDGTSGQFRSALNKLWPFSRKK